MNWIAPHYEEIKMDAEIGSYQVDPDEQPDATVSGSSPPVAETRIGVRLRESAP